MSYLNRIIVLVILSLILSIHAFGQAFVDLSDASTDWNKSIDINGQWDFYWKEFVDPVTMNAIRQPVPITVPSYWNNLNINGETLHGSGFGTYALKVIIPLNVNKHLAIFFPSIDVAYRLFIDGEEVYSCGKVSQDLKGEVPEYNASLVPFVAKSDTISLVLHVSNFNHRRGGIWQMPRLGEAIVMNNIRKGNSTLEMITLGILLSFGVFFLIFSFYYRSEKAIIYFAISFMFMFLRGMTTNQVPITFIDWIPWNWIIRIEYISMILSLFIGMWGFHFLVPVEWIRKLLKILNFIVAIIVLFILLFPVKLFAYCVFSFWGLLILGLSFFIVQIYFLIKNRSKYSKLYLIAIFSIFLGSIHDTFISNSIPLILDFYIVPHIYLFFILTQSVEFFKRFSNTVERSEKLSAELSVLNLNLEMKIKDRTQQLQEKNEIIEVQNQKLQNDIYIKNRFFSIVGHDISSPLASIRQGLELLTNPEMEISNRDYFLIKISHSAQSLSILVENLLSWGLSQNEQMKLMPGIKPIYPCVERVISQIANISEDKRIHLINDISKETYAYFDEITMVIIIRNLLTNALKFTPMGGKVTISEISTEKNITLKITDTGVGMDVDKIEKVISGKEVISTAGTNNERGTGLGLTLCKELIRLNGSEMFIESEPGVGSCFSFTLPISRDDNSTK